MSVEVTQAAQQAAIHGEGLRIGAYFCADDEGGHPYGKPEKCPFCQQEQNYTEMFYNGPGSPPSYAFCCGNCGAQGPTSSGWSRGDHYGARVNAVKDWNKASIAYHPQPTTAKIASQEVVERVIEVVRDQLASTDYPVSDYERNFAAAILAALPTTAALMADNARLRESRDQALVELARFRRELHALKGTGHE